MTKYTYQTIGTARFEINGYYSIAELEQLVVDLKAINEQYNKALADSLKEMMP